MTTIDKIPYRLNKILAELDATNGNLRLFDPPKFEKWLRKSCSDVVEQLIIFQRSLQQSEKEYLIRQCQERIKCLTISSKAKQAYVVIWQTVMKDLETRLNSFLFIILINSQTKPILGQEHPKIEFRAGTTVAVLAALTRVNFDSNLYQTSNKKEICRQVTGSYSTPSLSELGTCSFKNLFDYPTLDALNQVESNLLKQTKIVKNLKKETIRRDSLKV